MFVLIALSVILSLVIWRIFYSANRHAQYKSVPCPPGYPVIGNVYEFMITSRDDRMPLIRKYFARYGPAFRLYSFVSDSVNTSSADFAQFILTTNTFINKGYFYDFFKPWLGSGLITARDDKWRKQRKLLHPAFHYSILNNVCDTVGRKSGILIRKLEAELNSEWFDVVPYLYSCTLDVITETAMNINLNIQDGHSNEYSQSVQRLTRLIAERVTNLFIQLDITHQFSTNYKKQQECIRILHAVSSNIVEKKMMERQEHNVKDDSNHLTEKKKSLIEILLDLSDPVTGSFSMAEIKEQVDTFLFAGQDTVATSLSWTLLLVGQHPEVQKKIFEELNDVFGSSNHLPENEDLVQLKYLECVYKESLRLYPPIAFINRQITEDVVVGDYFIPAGVDLALHIHQLHRSPEHFPNPDQFDPSNFFLENAQKRHPYAFVPFSAGPRNCIGQKFAMTEAKIILAQIFRHFEVESAHSMKENKDILDLMLVPGGGAKIKIRKRLYST